LRRRRGSIQRAGVTLRYLVEGCGTPVLVVGSSVFYPRTFSRRLREACALAFADLRHFGEVGPGSSVGEVSFEVYAEDIERLRAAIGFETTVIVGHSHHGCMALEYARRYPERVTHVVMIATPPVNVERTMAAAAAYWTEHASMARKAVLERTQRALDPDRTGEAASGVAFVRRYVADGPRYWRDPYYDAAPLWEGVPIDMAAVSAFRALFARYELRWDSREMPAPVLVVTGRYDYVVPPTLWEAVLPELPGVTQHRFDESGHTPQLEEPERFDAVLLGWLRRDTAPEPCEPGAP
jgi:proline iminopeptidase